MYRAIRDRKSGEERQTRLERHREYAVSPLPPEFAEGGTVCSDEDRVDNAPAIVTKA